MRMQSVRLGIQARFINEEWPAVIDRMRRLGLGAKELLAAVKENAKGNTGGAG